MKTRRTIKANKYYTNYLRTDESFAYNSRGLMNEYSKKSAYVSNPNCTEAISDSNKVVWRYAYNPFGERESKRMDYSYKGKANGEVYPWVYYGLGLGNEQYAVYYGYNMAEGAEPHISGDGVCYYPNNTSIFYAGEYNIYTPSGQIVSYMLGEDGTFSKHYKILDQLGNTHLVLKGTEIVGSYLYEPFGKQITLYEKDSKDRMSFISKEKDIESELGDFGVRKYDCEIGRFTSIDPLWEKYYSWTPYHYCSNNPVMGSDPSGMLIYTSSDFRAGIFGNTFNNLVKNNSVFLGLIKPFIGVGKDLNYKYVKPYDMPPHKSDVMATTENYPDSDGETVIKSNIYFNSDRTDGTFGAELTELGKVHMLLHETIHPNTKYSENLDGSHNAFIERHHNTIISGLKEFSEDNNLGLNDFQINAVSWIGAQESDCFKSYIKETFQTQGGSYEEAYKSWQSFVAPLVTK